MDMIGGGGAGSSGGKQPSRTWRRLSLKQYKRAPTQDATEVSGTRHVIRANSVDENHSDSVECNPDNVESHLDRV